MSTIIVTYLAYLLTSICLTIWVARTLFKHGQPFLDHAFTGDERLARSVNHLLVVGFYLVNLGYITLNLKLYRSDLDARQAIEELSIKIGLVLLVLGAMHFFNLFVFNNIRKRRQNRIAAPPVFPNARLRDLPPENCDGGLCDPAESPSPNPA